MQNIIKQIDVANLNHAILAEHSNSHSRRAYIRTLLTPEFLTEVIKEYSSHTIACALQSIGIRTGAGQIINLCREYGILTHTYSSACFLSSVRQMKKSTNNQRHGHDNPSQSEEVKLKKRQKSLERYGTINVFQAEEIKVKAKKTMLEKYGVEHLTHLPDFNIKYRNCGRRSKLHQKVENMLIEMGVSFESEVSGKFLAYNPICQRQYSPIVDIMIEHAKLVIEVYGDMWHANPKVYKPEDIIIKFRGAQTAQEIWAFDKARIAQIESFGYKTLVLWESTIEFNREKTMAIIRHALNQN